MPEAFDGFPHRPVLYHEIIHHLRPSRNGLFVDATLGAGGHAWGILQESSPDGKLLGMDVDPQAIEMARQRLASFGSRATIVRASYTTLSEQLDALNWPMVDGILLDLGVSSMQLDASERGFSFQKIAPLDMRYDPELPVSAADLVNSLPEDDLSQMLFRYGEEPNARRIAKAIVEARPLETTGQLAEAISRIAGKRRRSGRKQIHPATRTFQALRIAVNRELESLERVLPQSVAALAPGGRVCVISFHSLEDRIVKEFFRRESQDCICPPRQPVCTCGHQATLVRITRRPLRPQQSEVETNPRSRSARLRVAERVG